MTKSLSEKLMKKYLEEGFEGFLSKRDWKNPIFTGYIVNSSFEWEVVLHIDTFRAYSDCAMTFPGFHTKVNDILKGFEW